MLTKDSEKCQDLSILNVAEAASIDTKSLAEAAGASNVIRLAVGSPVMPKMISGKFRSDDFRTGDTFMHTYNTLASDGEADNERISCSIPLLAGPPQIAPPFSADPLIVTRFIGTFVVRGEWLSDLQSTAIDLLTLQDNADLISIAMISKYADGTIKCEQSNGHLQRIEEQLNKEILSVDLSFGYERNSGMNKDVFNVISLHISTEGIHGVNEVGLDDFKSLSNIIRRSGGSITLRSYSSYSDLYNKIAAQVYAIMHPSSGALSILRLLSFLYIPAIMLFIMPLLLHLQIGGTKHDNFDKTFESLRQHSVVVAPNYNTNNDIVNRIDLLIESPYHADLTNSEKFYIAIFCVAFVFLIVSLLAAVFRRKKSFILCGNYAKRLYERKVRVDKLKIVCLIASISVSAAAVLKSMIYLNMISIVIR